MERSYAFELIDDPADPAWHGYAEQAPAPWWSSRRAQVAIAVAIVAGLALAAFALTRGGGSDSPSASPLSATTAVRVAPEPATIRTPPIAPAAPERPVVETPRAAEATTLRAAAHADDHAGEYELSPAEVNAYVQTWNASEGGSMFGRPGALVGDIDGLGASLSAGLEGLALRMNRSLVVISGTRTRAEQAVLYARFQAGTGNLAAPPGTSRHETGEAADVYVNGIALADVPGARRHAAALGLGFPVPGESWHVERVSTPSS